MKKIAILTDSNCGISPQEGKEQGIYILPMPVIIQEQIFYEGYEPEAVEISVTNRDSNFEKQDNNIYVKQSDFTIFNISENSRTFKTFTGEITNNSIVNLDKVAVIIIYKNSGQIIGGDIGFVDDMAAGSTKAFEISVDSGMTQYDSYDFYAIQW